MKTQHFRDRDIASASHTKEENGNCEPPGTSVENVRPNDQLTLLPFQANTPLLS